MDLLRVASVRFWKKKVRKDFEVWFNAEGRLHPEAEDVKLAGEKAVARAEACVVIQVVIWSEETLDINISKFS